MVFDGLNSTSKKDNYLYLKFRQGKRVSDCFMRDFRRTMDHGTNKNGIYFNRAGLRLPSVLQQKTSFIKCPLQIKIK